jgi:thiol:disulfide interchange protein
MKRLLACLLAILPLASQPAAPARAAESAPVSTPHATVTLLSSTDAPAPGKPFRLGLHFRLAAGWHIYWQNPGDAGAPPELSLDLPKDAKAGPIEWPAPAPQQEGPVTTYGYTGAVLLPFEVTSASGDIAATARVNWLICSDICVPESGTFNLSLNRGDGAPSAQAPLFAAAEAALPRPSPFTATIAPDGTLALRGNGLDAGAVRQARFIPATAGTIVDAAPQRLTALADGFTLKLQPGERFSANAPLSGVLRIDDRSGTTAALAIEAKPGLPGLSSAAGGVMGWHRMLLFAFLGGLILNLMPCVFPVLAMKAVALVRLSGAARGAARLSALSYTAGVLVAFAALGVALMAARAAGGAAGWGFQFQSPAFVAAMTWLLFGVGLNLSGVFEIGGRLTGAGQSLTGRGGQAGSFFTGLLAVLVATPCTAPFMGAAIAAALAAPPWVTLSVFLAMGLGLAAPYVALALIPSLARAAPKPGVWMEVLKQALAFPMYGAAAWLVWVIAQEAGASGVLASVTGLVLIGFAGWAFGRAQAATGRQWRRVGRSAAVAAMLAAIALLSGIAVAPPAAPTGSLAAAGGPARIAGDGSEPFSPARLAALRAEKRPVLVDMSAAWCVTCLVNERIALDTAPVRAAFKANNVAYLKGDWTREDPAITAFLRAHGRDGVPLYVFYPAGGEPRILPQILTPGIVLAAITPSGTSAER